jgi:hypothetical protein
MCVERACTRCTQRTTPAGQTLTLHSGQVLQLPTIASNAKGKCCISAEEVRRAPTACVRVRDRC